MIPIIAETATTWGSRLQHSVNTDDKKAHAVNLNVLVVYIKDLEEPAKSVKVPKYAPKSVGDLTQTLLIHLLYSHKQRKLLMRASLQETLRLSRQANIRYLIFSTRKFRNQHHKQWKLLMRASIQETLRLSRQANIRYLIFSTRKFRNQHHKQWKLLMRASLQANLRYLILSMRK